MRVSPPWGGGGLSLGEAQSVKEELRGGKTKFMTEQTDALPPSIVWLTTKRPVVGMASHTYMCSLTV